MTQDIQKKIEMIKETYEELNQMVNQLYGVSKEI